MQDDHSSLNHPQTNGENHDEQAQPSTSTATDSNRVAEHGLENGTNGTDEAQSSTVEESRGRKRKLDDVAALKKDRRVSPPWKRIEAEGPTSYVDSDGRRKSTRTNIVPSPQPSQGRRSTRQVGNAATPTIQPSPLSKTRSRVSDRYYYQITDEPQGSRRESTGHSRSTTRNVNTPHVATSRRRSEVSTPAKSSTPSKRTPRSSAASQTRESLAKTHPNRRTSSRLQTSINVPTEVPASRRVRLTLGPRPLPIFNYHNIPKSKRFTSLAEYLEQDDPLEDGEVERYTLEKAQEEAQNIESVVTAGREGLLTEAKLMEHQAPQAALEPPIPYSHLDYFIKHAEDLILRVQREAREHRALAKRIAIAAAAEAVRRQPETPEARLERLLKEAKTTFKVGMKEMERYWSSAKSKVDRMKVVEYEQAQDEAARQQMRTWLERSEKRVAERQQLSLNDIHDFHSSELDETEGTEYTDDVDDIIDDEKDSSEEASGSNSEEDDDNLSEDTETEEEDDHAVDRGDDDLDVEQLRLKYANLDENDSKVVSLEGREEKGLHLTNGIHNRDDMPLANGVSPNTQTKADTSFSLQTKEFPTKANNKGQLSPLAQPEGDNARSSSPKPQDLGFDINLPDDKLTADQLRIKYANLPDIQDSIQENADMADDEDSDDYGSSDDSEDSEESGDESDVDMSEEEDAGGSSLLGFLSKSERVALEQEKPTEDDVMDSADVEMIDAEDVSRVEDAAPVATTREVDHSQGESTLQLEGPATPRAPTEQSEMASSMSAPLVKTEEPQEIKAIDSNAMPEPGTVKLAPPPLLRGNLRMYQQYGLEWLAGMYVNDTNGILADEMGLGKTIQTISLLAWLACERQIWGPHLIVVPTSVLLNWEMEFKKFCPGFKILTYFGTIDERAQKRKGWTDDTKWNVCITSYQLAVSDANVLKRRSWHYLILDEAHNIKNFRSQRWQTLLSFNSRARLLLTGTPLQNNLTELWSLLFFLSPQTNEKGETEFGELAEFSKNFNKPVEQILNQGRDGLDDEAKTVVMKLHKVLRPHLLRRLKKDVEKQMPKKYEHVTVCRLSKRQRQLYDGYMRLADTKESFASGNYMSIINCLMQLRKVCNHPDLFETRQIVTSYAMKKPVMERFSVKEDMIRNRLFEGLTGRIESGSVLNIWRAPQKCGYTRFSRHDSIVSKLQEDVEQHQKAMSASKDFDGQTIVSALDVLQNVALQARLDHRKQQLSTTQWYTSRQPLYRKKLLEMLTLDPPTLKPAPKRVADITESYLSSSSVLQNMIINLPDRAAQLEPYIQRFVCVTPAVVTHGMTDLILPQPLTTAIQASQQYNVCPDPYHEARTRLSIAFPDKGLIQYDCGKLQQLDGLLRRLQANGSRALIFTQMTKVLDILEQFLNLHGHRYLRLDGSTKIENRLALTERFNNDPRILAFIASSRSGGLGINLTGADTVIFYDLDWNPAMDKQCQDRCHRIGQTRDVHIYRFVCEGTIEANILRKSNQKRMLDDVVIQEGDFTTEYFNALGTKDDDAGAVTDADDETAAALDKVFGRSGPDHNPIERVLEQAEDTEDREAAKKAEKEDVQMDGEDFEESAAKAKAAASANASVSVSVSTPRSAEPSPALSPAPEHTEKQGPATPAEVEGEPDTEVPDEEADEAEQEEEDLAPSDLARPIRDVGSWMFEYLKWELRDVKFVPAGDRTKKKAGRKARDFGVPRIRR